VQPVVDRLTEWGAAHVPNAFRIVLIPVAAYVTIKLLNKLVRRLEKLADDGDPATQSELEKRAATLGRILRQAIGVFVWGTAAMLVLSELGISIGPILAGAGIAGIAVGLGAQTLVKDVIGGFFILLENQFRVHDVIGVAGVSGKVEAINLRTTLLRDAEGRVHVIPNGAISVVTNYTREWSVAMLDVGVPYAEDLDRVLSVLKRVGGGIEQDPVVGRKLLQKFEYPGIETFGESAVIVRMLVRTLPQERWDVARELRARVKKAFDESGIEIPFRHVTVQLDGKAAEGLKGVKARDGAAP
jgi:moderate conductance mechanosensitive channel